MRFKIWIEEIGTSMMFGGASVDANPKTNSNMPVRSKYQTSDATNDKQKSIINADNMFGFKKPNDKKRSQESSTDIINRYSKPVPNRADYLGITY